MSEEDRREFWKYAVFTAATSVLVGHMFYTMWLEGAWVYASELTSSLGLVPDGATGVTAGLLFGFGIYLGFLLVFMQNRRKYYQGLILLGGTAASIGVLAVLGIGLPGFEPTMLNVAAFVSGLAVVVLAEMISTEITLPIPDLSDDSGLFRTIELEGRLHQIDRKQSSWGHAVDIRDNPLQFPVATYGLLGYIIAVVLVSNAMNFLVSMPGVGSLQVAHLVFSVVFLWVLGSFLSLNPSSDSELQVLGPTSSGKTYFVLAAALEAQRNDRFEMGNSTGWINGLVEGHKEWARKNREATDRTLKWDIDYTETGQIYQTDFTVTTNDRIPKALHFNVVDHPGEILSDVADRVGAVTDGGVNEDGTTVDLICPECGFKAAVDSTSRAGDICPECREGYLETASSDANPPVEESDGDSDQSGNLNNNVAPFGRSTDTSEESADASDDTESLNVAEGDEPVDDEPEETGPFGGDPTEFDTDDEEEIEEDTDSAFDDDDTEADEEAVEDAEIIDDDDDEADPSTDDASSVDQTSTDDGTEAAGTTDRTSSKYNRTGGADTKNGDTADGTGSDDESTNATTDDEADSADADATDDQSASSSAESLSNREVINRLEEKVLESDTLLFMLDCERLIGRKPAGKGSESLETTEMNRIVNGADPDRVILVGTKADILIDEWKQWHRAHNGAEVDKDRLPDPHEVDQYERSFREYMTERFEDEAGMLLTNADTNTVYPVYFETEMVDTGEGEVAEKDRRDDDVEWAPVPNEHGELQPHGYDHVLAAITTDG